MFPFFPLNECKYIGEWLNGCLVSGGEQFLANLSEFRCTAPAR